MLLFACITTVSCRSHHDDMPDDGNGSLTLNLKVSTAGSRASVDLPAEALSRLRVVVVNKIGQGNSIVENVEYNEVFSNLDVDAGNRLALRLHDIKPGHQKRLYLLANAEDPALEVRTVTGLKLDLSDDDIYLRDGTGKSLVEGAIFTAPSGTYMRNNILPAGSPLLVPMTAIHEIEVPEINNIPSQNLSKLGNDYYYNFPVELYLVRAMNKVSFEFYNTSGMDILISSFSLHQTNSTGDTYLFANLDESVSNPVYESFTPDDGINPLWMQWLDYEAVKTSPDGVTSGNEWLTNYRLPSASNSVFTFKKSESTVPSSESDGIFMPAATQALTDAVYFPESRYIPQGSEQQKYQVSLIVWKKDNNNWVKVEGFSDSLKELNNLKSLFRNTNVIIKVTFLNIGLDKYDIEVMVDVDPWDEAELNPSLGKVTWGSITDNDPWDEGELNPGHGSGGNGGDTDNDPWDEDELNPGYGSGDNGGITDNDPWDESEQNPSFG